jgi:hypothetical protein
MIGFIGTLIAVDACRLAWPVARVLELEHLTEVRTPRRPVEHTAA